MREWIAIFTVLVNGIFTAAGADAEFPAIHRVTGVSGDDVLNVRSGPSTGYPVIDGLRNGTQVEVTASSGDGWARILRGEGNGWVATRYLELLTASSLPEALFCSGTEPFWSLTLEKDGALTFTEMDREPAKLSPDWRHSVTGRLNGSFAAGDDRAIALFHRRDCSDGMSDRTYGWAVDFLRTGGQGAYLQGCCRMLR